MERHLSDEEMEDWRRFSNSVDYFLRDRGYDLNFLANLSDLRDIMLSARDIIERIEELYDLWKKDEKRGEIIYEMRDMMDYLSERMEDVAYLLNRIKEDNCVREKDKKMGEIMRDLAENLKMQCETLYHILLVKYHWLLLTLLLIEEAGNVK